MVRAIEQGYPQGEIEKSAYTYQQRIESGDQIIVGMNKFTDDKESVPPIMKMDPLGEKLQCDRLAALRASRNKSSADAALKSLTRSAKDGSNLMPRIVEAIRQKVTLGEISDALRAEFGEYRGRDGF
jgi:methylmalonyl-CoA mutase N-terminal domain/subunit